MSETGSQSQRAGTLHVPIVPMSVKLPVARSMLYIETLFEPEFVTYANFPDGWMAIEVGDSSVAIVPMGVKPPVAASMVYIETLPSVLGPVQFAT